jgi:hypothetical protein
MFVYVVAAFPSTMVGGFVPPWQTDVPHVPGPVLSKRGKTSVDQLTAQAAVPPLDDVPPEEAVPDEEAVPEEDAPDEEPLDPLDEPDELPEEEPLDDPEDDPDDDPLEEEDDPLPGWGACLPTRPLGGPKFVSVSPPHAAATAAATTKAERASRETRMTHRNCRTRARRCRFASAGGKPRIRTL